MNVIEVNVRVIPGVDTTKMPDGDPSNPDTRLVTDSLLTARIVVVCVNGVDTVSGG